MTDDQNPLVDPSPREVPLSNAPLVRVITQVRFPQILSIEKREFIASFQEEIREKYPVLRVERAQGVLLTPHGVAESEKQVVWRFNDAESRWRVSLAPDFIALETTSYSSRTDLMDRFRKVIDALVFSGGVSLIHPAAIY